MSEAEGDRPRDLDEAIARVATIAEESDAPGDELESVGGFGHYSGLPPQVALLDDGRLAHLLAPISYTHQSGAEWPVPAGVKLDGASIPRPFWSVIGGPFEGKYRNASIVHDHYCVVKMRDWQATHRMFHDAMRCSGVGRTKAKIMFYAVYRFGPRWGGTAESVYGAEPAPAAPTDADAAAILRMAILIRDEDPNLEEIARIADRQEAEGRTG